MLPKAFKIYVTILSLAIVVLVSAIFILGKNTESSRTPSSSPSSAPAATETVSPQGNQTYYPVVDVVDGDTMKVQVGDKVETLRLIGIDTPETVDPRKTVQCFGREASDRAKALLTGKKVYLESDPTQGERDKYGRLLRYVYLEDGTFYNKYMVSEGYAHEYTYQSNPYKYQAEFKQAEKDARDQGKGLWSSTTCSGVTTSNRAVPMPSSSSVVTDDGIDYDCTDFQDQAEAQAYFESQGGSATNDVDRLDANHDGLACK